MTIQWAHGIAFRFLQKTSQKGRCRRKNEGQRGNFKVRVLGALQKSFLLRMREGDVVSTTTAFLTSRLSRSLAVSLVAVIPCHFLRGSAKIGVYQQYPIPPLNSIIINVALFAIVGRWRSFADIDRIIGGPFHPISSRWGQWFLEKRGRLLRDGLGSMAQLQR